MEERLIVLAGIKIRRCHECNLRFATTGNSVLMIRDVEQVVRKLSVALLAVLALAIVLAAILWFTSRQAAPSPSKAGAALLRPRVTGNSARRPKTVPRLDVHV
jgi:hypothetical protein